MTYKITEYFSETKETIERDATADEIIAIDKRKADEEERKLTKQAEAEAKATAKAAAESKLTALGLTTQDLRALGL